MPTRAIANSPLLSGLALGFLFGFVNLVLTWLNPLDDDTPATLLRFYGPMFLLWALVAFRSARRSGRLRSGVMAGALVAFATFCVLNGLVLLRVNLFLTDLTRRADWRDMMMRFQTSGFDSLRLFVNVDYIKGLPFKTCVASAIGGLMGVIGGSVGWLMRRRKAVTA